jgi:hypothetical protein
VHVADRYGSGDVSLAELNNACGSKREVAQCMELITWAFVSAEDIHRTEIYKALIFSFVLSFACPVNVPL